MHVHGENEGLNVPLDESSPTVDPEVSLHLTGTNTPPRSCTLLGVSHGKIHLRTTQWIEPASRVTAIFAHITLAGEVVYCTRKDDAYRACIAMISESENDQRREPRIPVRQPGTIIVLSDEGSESTQGTLLDLSKSGMRLDISHRVETGTMVFFVTDSNAVAGEVRYCHQRRSGYFEAGVEIVDIMSDAGRNIRQENSPQTRAGSP